MSKIDQGEPIVFEARFYDKDPDAGGVLTDPGLPVTLTVKRPDGTRDTGLPVTKVSTGVFRHVYATKDGQGNLYPSGTYFALFEADDDAREQVYRDVVADQTQ